MSKKRIGYELAIGAMYGVMEFEKASGSGSYSLNTREYCSKLLQKLKELNVKKVVDFGCGNHETYKGHIDWSQESIEYVGYDVNIHCIEELNKRYPALDFKTVDLDVVPVESGADAIIIKDVMIHWFDHTIKNWFEQAFENYRYVIYMHETKDQGYTQKHGDRRHGPAKAYGAEYNKTFNDHLYGYRSVPPKLLPHTLIIHKENMMLNAYKTFIIFDRDRFKK
jgi:hypothetical protein